MSENNDNQPATKGDLAAVETGLKGDLAVVKADIAAVKGDLAAVKTELDQKIERVYLSQVQADTELGRKMDRMSDKMDKLYGDLMSAFEKTVVKGEKYDQKAVTHGGILTDHDDKLLNPTASKVG